MLRLILSLCALLLLVPCAQAQGIFFRIDIAEELSGKTLWAEAMPDRYYFGENGTLLKQYAVARSNYQAGDVREGVWRVENDQLCLLYKDAESQECYQVNKDTAARGPWGRYDDLYHVHSTEDDAQFYWNRWINGNMILAPDTWRAVTNGKSTGFSADRYRSAIIGKIMILPMGQVYHHQNGQAFWIRDTSIEAVKNDASVLSDASFLETHKVAETGWKIENDRHCWFPDNENEMCAAVVDAQNGYVPQAGFFHILDDGFIRLIKPENLIATK